MPERSTPISADEPPAGPAVVWVSGAAGKLGREVTHHLRQAGHQVIEADSHGPTPVELTDARAVAASMAGANVMVHCAAIPSPENIDPAELVHNNTMACFNALEQAWLAGIRTAVLASSGSIYGTAWSPEPLAFAEVPITEETPLAYVDPYALSKDFTERMGQMFSRRGMTVTALRLHWILSAAESRRVAHASDDAAGVANLWGYVDLHDAARACLLALQPRAEHRGYEVLVIAGDDTLSDVPTEELLSRYLPETHRRRRFVGHDGLFDTSRAAEVLDWRPTHSWRRQPIDPDVEGTRA
jgi:nucleoside-diphosphate-sugar epimerase